MTDLTSVSPRPLVLAQYLPQFHPILENDRFWGEGFTEWRSVALSRPRFPGHEQPCLPGELGFYDLRAPETRRAQAELARDHGIDGFVYYHYWLHGRRLLERPFDEVLQSGEPDFPFCLCWANEQWDGTWNGRSDRIFVEQRYSDADDEAHGQYLVRAFLDPRYLRVNGRPLLIVYRIQDLPNPHATLARWARQCRDAGMEAPYVVRFETYGDVVDPASYGADAAAEFFPHVPEALLEAARVAGLGRPGDFFLNYDAVAQQMTARREPGWVRYPAVVPGWDNTARRQERPALGLVGATPRRYERWLRDVLARQVNERPPGQRIVFINAWNEWAESACLEPTATHGRAYLEATVAAVGLERPPEVSLARQLEGDFRDRCRRHIGWLGAADREMQRATGPLREQVALARLELARLEQALEW